MTRELKSVSTDPQTSKLGDNLFFFSEKGEEKVIDGNLSQMNRLHAVKCCYMPLLCCCLLFHGRHNTQHNDIKQNDTLRGNKKHDTWHEGIHQNGT